MFMWLNDAFSFPLQSDFGALSLHRHPPPTTPLLSPVHSEMAVSLYVLAFLAFIPDIAGSCGYTTMHFETK